MKFMNKYILKYRTTSLAVLVLLGLSSCLKDKGFEDGTYGLAGFAGGEFVSIGYAGRNPNSLSLESKSGDQTINLFQVTYEYVDPAKEDIKVAFKKDDAAVTAADATLTLLPASVVSFPSPDVTIAKGKRVSNTFAIKINTSTLDPKKAYGLAFTITTISKTGVATSSNLSTVVYKIALKNKYDGFYEVTGKMTDYVAPTLTGLYPHTVNLYTAGPDAVDYGQTMYNFGASYPRGEIHLILSGASASGYGLFAPVFKFDASDKVIAVTNFWGQPSGNGRAARLDATGINKYDPATKTIKVKYWMVQGTDRTLFDETFTWKKAR
jgi:hypothetical protein